MTSTRITAAMLCLSLAGSTRAQGVDSTEATLTLSAYADGYFAVYSGRLDPQQLQPYATASPRDNTLGINIAQVGLQYESNRVRSAVVLHYGDIAQATWDERFRPVQTAYAGLRLRENLWFDLGFFTTHIGAEGFLPKDNMLSQTAVLTYNEPFYQAGARFMYAPSERWELQLWGLNGYNLFVDDNDAKSLGVNVSYAASDDWSLAYGNVLGREGLDENRARPLRLYQYTSAEFDRGRWYSLTSLDHGLQTNTANAGASTAHLVAGQSTLRYRITDEYAITTRIEFYDDPDGFVSGTLPRVGTPTPEGLRWLALTLGAEWSPAEGAYLRLEGRYGRAQNRLEVFGRTGDTRDRRLEAMVTLGHAFERVIGRY